MRRTGSRLARLVLLVAVLSVVAVEPASADPPAPTDFRSEITGIVPQVSTVSVEVLGGDSFLRLAVEPGTEVVVLGYEDEPYLRFDTDGLVYANQLSQATYLNEDRYGVAEVPLKVDADAEPVWEEVGSGGTHAWHDHRVHWMLQSDPPTQIGADGAAVVQPWIVPLLVDEEPVEIVGRLVAENAPNPILHYAAAAVIAVVVFFGGRSHPLLVAPIAALMGSVGALVVGWTEWTAVPAEVRIAPVAWWLPATAVVASAVAVVVRRPPMPALGSLVASAGVVGWAATRLAVFSNAVLPTTLAAGLDRGLTAAAVGFVVGAAALVVGSRALVPLPPGQGGEHVGGSAPDDPGVVSG